MTDRLHTFTPLHEVLEQGQRFHDTASNLLDQWAAEDEASRISSFLKLAARHERVVADSLARAIAGDDLGSAETFYQSPPETIPSTEELSALASQRQDLDAFAAALHTLHERWVAIYKALQATNPARRVDELLGNCRELIERLERQLSSAQVQQQDL
ncbi:MAG TPA: hypothetical protein VFN67_39380 [Polyangiales bacterium]|jgi:hypothetical protein|nr:hypothetical protein [Polyangiales bacterium]